jgi:hypothetical protein
LDRGGSIKKKRATKKKVTKAKGTKPAKRKTRRQSDLSPKAVRGGAVKGGAVDTFAKIGTIKGESQDDPRLDKARSISIMKF